jgi:hypothetical protein
VGDPAGLGPWAPGLYNMVCYKTQNLPAGAADFVCLCEASGECGLGRGDLRAHSSGCFLNKGWVFNSRVHY